MSLRTLDARSLRLSSSALRHDRSDAFAVNGYITPPFSPTSTSSHSSNQQVAVSTPRLGSWEENPQEAREGTWDRLASGVHRAKEKGLQKLMLDTHHHHHHHPTERYSRSAVVDEEGNEHDPEYVQFRTAAPVHRMRSDSASAQSSSATSSSSVTSDSEDGTQYSMGTTPFSTGVLSGRSIAPSPLAGTAPSYLPSAHHSLIKPHASQIMPALLVPPSNMASSSSGSRSRRSKPHDLRAYEAPRRTSADYSQAAVNSMGYHLESIQVPKDGKGLGATKKKRRLSGLATNVVHAAATGSHHHGADSRKGGRAASPLPPTPTTARPSAAQLNENGLKSPTSTTFRSSMSPAPLRSVSSMYPSSTAKLSSTAAAHSRPIEGGLIRPAYARMVSATSSTSELILPTPTIGGLPTFALTKAISGGDESLSGPGRNVSSPPLGRSTTTGGGGTNETKDGKGGPLFVPAPGKLARRTREVQEDFAIGTHGMRRSFESFKLDVRFGMLRTKKKMERAVRQL